jgi:hypothetical protein
VAGGSGRVIVVLGDIPATGHIANAEALRGPDLTSRDDAALAFLDLVADNLSATAEGMLVVYPDWQADTAKRLIRLIRGMLDTDKVASIGLKLPPLACSLVADLLSHSASDLEIGYVAGLGRRLEQEILSGARLGTVARLEHIETKLTHHMASYNPGSGFLAWAAPRARVDRITRNKQVDPGGFRPADPVHLLIAPHGADFADFEKDLTASLRPDVVKTVAAQPLGATFWGTRKHVEFVAFSGHPEALSDIMRSTRYWMCRWCRQPTSLEVCAICGMFQEDMAAVSVPAGAPRTAGTSDAANTSVDAVVTDGGRHVNGFTTTARSDDGRNITRTATAVDDPRTVAFGRRNANEAADGKDDRSAAEAGHRSAEDRPVVGSPDAAAGRNGKALPTQQNSKDP